MDTFLTNHSCTLPLLPSPPLLFLLATIASGSAVMGAIIAKGFERVGVNGQVSNLFILIIDSFMSSVFVFISWALPLPD